ncbi:hypothetical protein CQW23_14565 [Capsicum baccatum]|uniref:F-box domain-containing protein n=1 Tax=Capsicum baccatum TaxID=33114 RepID=A0A2G2WJI3_CAPBA|nr:hypothetical protein CQW23_14565 [Capsicum baccatum]
MTFDCFCVGTSSKKKTMFSDLKGKPSNNIPEGKIVEINLDSAMEIHLPEEIILDILIRLPVQSLLRFKCASKFWKTLISDPHFKVKHCNHAKNYKKILISRRLPEVGISYYSCSLSSSSAQPLQKLGCPSNHKPCGYVILCCCDGFSLLWYRAGYLLWNPSTNESVELPNHEFPGETCSTYGLGFDLINNEYKILKVDYDSSGPRTHTKIFALKSGSWRNIDNHPRGFHNRVCPQDSLAFVRDAFHWICMDNLDNLSPYFMISFNISSEVYGEISLPEGICNILNDVRYARCAVSVLDGMLCAYCTCREGGMGTFKLWVMKDYDVKESWNELFIIQDPDIFLAVPKYWFADGEVLLYYEDKQYREFRTSRGPYEMLDSYLTLLQGYVYTESLISPKLFI